MTIQACIFFLACAFYLGYFAESSLFGFEGKKVVWVFSLTLWLIPTILLIYQMIRRVFL